MIHSQLTTLTKQEIHEAIGATCSTRVMKFCRECDRKGLISWVKHIETTYGSFKAGLESLAKQYPTEINLVYINTGYVYKDGYSRIPTKTVKNYPTDSLWVQWLEVLDSPNVDLPLFN